MKLALAYSTKDRVDLTEQVIKVPVAYLDDCETVI
jgi:hypothetical protein